MLLTAMWPHFQQERYEKPGWHCALKPSSLWRLLCVPRCVFAAQKYFLLSIFKSSLPEWCCLSGWWKSFLSWIMPNRSFSTGTLPHCVHRHVLFATLPPCVHRDTLTTTIHCKPFWLLVILVSPLSAVEMHLLSSSYSQLALTHCWHLSHTHCSVSPCLGALDVHACDSVALGEAAWTAETLCAVVEKIVWDTY